MTRRRAPAALAPSWAGRDLLGPEGEMQGLLDRVHRHFFDSLGPPAEPMTAPPRERGRRASRTTRSQPC